MITQRSVSPANMGRGRQNVEVLQHTCTTSSRPRNILISVCFLWWSTDMAPLSENKSRRWRSLNTHDIHARSAGRTQSSDKRLASGNVEGVGSRLLVVLGLSRKF